MFTRKPRDDARFRLPDIMRLRGAHLPEPMNAADATDYAAAQVRCRACLRKLLCDELLAMGDARGFGLFCPNSHYVERLRSQSLNFR